MEFSPISAKRVLIAVTSDGNVDAYVCSTTCTTAGNWSQSSDVVDLWSTEPTNGRRPFDIQFEHTSGDLLFVYDKVSASASQDIFYRILAAADTTFGSENNFNDSTAAGTDVLYSFIKLASSSVASSDNIAVAAIDETNSDGLAWIWSGSAWENEQEITTSIAAASTPSIDIGYEESGDVVLVVGESTPAVRYNTFVSGSWGTSSTSTGTWAIGTPTGIHLYPNPTTDEMFLIGAGNLLDIDTAYWNGSSWTDHAEHDSDIASNADWSRAFAWEYNTSAGIFMWDTATTVINYKRFTAPSTFSSAGTISDDGATHRNILLATNPTEADTNKVLGEASDTDNDLSALFWTGGSNNPTNSDDAFTIGLESNIRPSFYIAFQLSAGGSSFSQTLNETITSTEGRTTTFDKSQPESSTFTEGRSTSFDKLQPETSSYSEDRMITFEKLNGETWTSTDGEIWAIDKLMAELLGSTENRFIEFTKAAFDESFSTIDTAIAGIGKLLDESFSFAEEKTIDFTKVATEAIDTADTRLTDFTKVATESFNTLDEVLGELSGIILAETISFAEDRSSSFIKSIVETWATLDEILAGAGQEFSVTLNEFIAWAESGLQIQISNRIGGGDDTGDCFLIIVVGSTGLCI